MNRLLASARRLVARVQAAALLKKEEGASLVEYGLLVGLIAVVCIGAISYIGTTASSKYSVYDNCVAWAGTGGTVPAVCH